MPASTTPQNPSTTSSTARALIISIRDFSKFREKVNPYYPDLGLTHKSGDEFIEILEKQRGYIYSDYGSNYRRLRDSQATLGNVIRAIIKLAKETKEGDVVTITISSHGNVKKKHSSHSAPINFNYCVLYDQTLTEFELFILLRLFKKGVRVHICFDFCHAGTWADFATFYHVDELATISALAGKLEDTNENTLAKFFLQDYSSDFMAMSIQASVFLLGGIHDIFEMNDGYNSAHVMLRTINSNGGREFKANELFPLIRNQIIKDMEDGYATVLWDGWYRKYQTRVKGITTSDSSIPVPVFDKNNIDHIKVISYFVPRYLTQGEDVGIFNRVPLFGLY